MKKIFAVTLLALAAGAAVAVPVGQNADPLKGGIAVSTDPAKAEQVERQAAQLQARQDRAGTSGTGSHAKPHHHHRHHHAKAAKSQGEPASPAPAQ
jgi:hypothetical protein